ncbi:exosortase A [Hydrogenophaga sp.]|uniref:exosortase A n=1 Tax=Hydrogenophaga sp. TaxID=1904254 RepID=UPI00272FE63C|nr:exosortase A [Hydrogenophaga sp.]MDP1684462.1 exosortase A [Hydrogenophaga sp.]
MPDAARFPAHWRLPLASLVLLLLAILGLHAQTVVGMVTIWSRSDTYAHGFVVPVISLWLIWRIRHTLAALVPRPSRLAWLLLLGAAGLWLAGDLVAVNAATQLALVMLLVLAVPAVLGWQLALAMAFPLGFLFFAVPIGDFMLPYFMEWTADFTVLALRLSGIPVYREGLQFIIPSGSWSVVEACSGIRYMIASVTVGCLFAYLSYTRLTKRFIFVGVSILVPLVANWLRAYMIVMIGHLSGNELATGVDHLIYGWVFFGVVILIMLFVGARWADAPEPPAGPVSSSVPANAPALGRQAAIAALVSLFIVASPHVLERLLALGTQTAPVALGAPAVQAPWQPAAQPPSDWVPAFQFPSATSHIGYSGPQGEAVGLQLSYYRQQDYERKLVSSQNMLVVHDDKQWAQVSGGNATTQLAGQPLTVAAATLRNQIGGLASSSQRLQVWRFYWVNNRFTASDALAKIQGALSRITGQGDDGAIVVIYTPLDPQRTEADARVAATAVLQSFLQSQGSAIEAALKTTRGAP